ncbi:hypothetical protein B0A50_02230 [Salinomyces thailandicus]|uniref:Uncharacterized protein n=1 Tax=Salinomyces thailandicus TaxID=706561 RepID=A0A4U0U8G9_9PEZI|nr:hypothetical protein B0A50_02230 [Salinomyces thailandica]
MATGMDLQETYQRTVVPQHDLLLCIRLAVACRTSDLPSKAEPGIATSQMAVNKATASLLFELLLRRS